MNIDESGKSVVAANDAVPANPPTAPSQAADHDQNDRHFRTNHLLTNLKQRTISGGAVTITSQAAKFGVTLLSTVVLARLLSPHDFGLLAMVTSIMSLLYVFKDGGLSSATIQREGITHAQVSNLFWINVGISGTLALALAAAAPVIAWFYREPQLIGVALWLSVTFLLSGSTVQHHALLTRQMRFKALAAIQVGSMVVGLATGLTMAFFGCGYWSLVGMNLAMEGSSFLLTWSLSSWRPQLPQRDSGTRPLIHFGLSMTAGSALYIISSNADSILLGRFYGSESVGLYSRAMALLTRPYSQLMGPIGAVFVPTLSRLKNEPERYRRVFMQLYEAMALVGFASAGLLLALSRPITLVLLGPKWEQTVPIVASLAIAALYFPVGVAAGWLLISQGRGKDYVHMNWTSAALTIASFVVGLPYGPIGLALAYSVSGLLVRLPISYYIIGRRGPVSARDLWSSFFRHLPLWFVSSGVTYGAVTLLADHSPLVQLMLCGSIGLAACGVCIYVIKGQRTIAIDLLHSARGFMSPYWVHLKSK